MKNSRKWLAVAGALLICVTSVLCESTMRRLITVPFTTIGSYTLATTAGYLGIETVDMTVTGTALSNNTFTLSLVRGGVTHILLSQTAVSTKTIVWLMPSSVYLQTNDQLVWSNSVAGAAIMTFNGEVK